MKRLQFGFGNSRSQGCHSSRSRAGPRRHSSAGEPPAQSGRHRHRQRRPGGRFFFAIKSGDNGIHNSSFTGVFIAGLTWCQPSPACRTGFPARNGIIPENRCAGFSSVVSDAIDDKINKKYGGAGKVHLSWQTRWTLVLL